MAVVDSREHLLDDIGCIFLAEVLLFRDLIEKFTSITKPTRIS